MWPFDLFRREKTDFEKIAEGARRIGAVHKIDCFVCPRNCSTDGKIALMPLPKGSPAPNCPTCGTRMVPL
jgi:hypothetical protein